MIFNEHSNLEGSHAFLSASKYSWLNYDNEKLVTTYKNHLATLRGTELHEWARRTIELKRRQLQNKDTVNMYINDAIGYRMKAEQILYYSPFIFGTADAISFQKGVLRIHDLKTGERPVSMNQLMIYAALFCLEYNKKPSNIDIELRIYQNGNVVVHNPETEEIVQIMEKIIQFDKILSELSDEE